jgi:predicted RNA binding protein YcfA (HicA-like mRNA interferase family)
MPGLGPCKRREFIRKLKSLGYDGPFAGGKHAFMSRTAAATVPGAQTVTLPNTDLDIPLLSRVLKQSGISHNDFLSA